MAILAGLLGLGLAGCTSSGQSTGTQPTTSPATLSNSNNPNAFVVGVAGSYTFTASGNPAPTMIETGALPNGLTFSDGILAGTPAAGTARSYPITITAHNGVGADATQTFTLTVNQTAAIASGNNTTFTFGTLGSFSVTATGSPVPTLAESGNLPAGVTFNPATGILSGTPTSSGAFPITFTAHNGVGADATQSFTLTVDQGAAITSGNNDTMTVGFAGSFSVTATGFPAPTLSEIGALPTGVQFTGGTLVGTPVAGTVGSYPITITAHNGVGTDATQNFTLTVDQVAAITSANNATFGFGVLGTFSVMATGFPAPTLSESGNMPAGVTFNAATGILSGTPTSSGAFPITFTAHNGVGVDATQNFTLSVDQSAAITSANNTTFNFGTLGTFSVTAIGFPAATLTQSGTLPAGVTFTAATGILSGTPTVSGTFPIMFTAHNGVGADATQNFTLTVDQSAAITSANNTTFNLGTLGTFSVTATGFPAPALSESGNLPTGVAFNPTTGILSGTPTANGAFPITFTAHNGVGADATQSFTLTVDQNAAITSGNNTTMIVGVAGSFTVTATGFPAPTFTETGALPTGVHFTAGVLAGTAGAGTAGNYPITITAHNGVGADATQSFTLTVNQVAAITSGNNTTFSFGTLGSFSVTATGSPTPTLSETGALPTGVTFNTATGILSGPPTTSGAFPITFTAHNGVGADATQSFTLTVDQSTTITSASSTTMSVGFAGSFPVTATGFPAPTFTEAGALPNGVHLTGGVLAGTPAAGTVGSYPITITAHNGIGADATQAFMLIVNQAPAFSSPSSVTFYVGALDSFTLTTTGFPAPTIGESGATPTGVGFNSSTGLLSGTPAAGTAGSYPITFTANNGVGPSVTQSFILTVVAGTNAPSINSPNNAIFVTGFAGTFTVTATGSPTPVLSETGALPTGVTFNAATGVLSGTPAAGSLASYPITFTAINSQAPNATQSFILTVDSVPAISTAPQNQTVGVGQPATFMVSATGSVPLAYQWQSNGVDIGGATSSTYTTPATKATDNGTNFTVVVSNAVGSVTSSAATLTVNTPPSIVSSPANQSLVVGETATFNATIAVQGTLPLNYQWSKNSVAIPGATSPSYTTPATLLTDSGEQFSVTVSNSLGSASSSAAILTVSAPVSPATYYVDFASGTDANSGLSKSAPWKYAPGMSGCAINCKLFGLKPGDKVIFKGGVTWDVTGFPLVVTASGTSGNPIYFGVDQTWFAGSAWSRPAFDLENSTWSVAPILANTVNFVTFDNLEIKNEAVNNSGVWPPRSGISVNGGSNIIIQNCYIHGWSIQQPVNRSDSAPTGGIAFYNGSVAGTVQNCVLDGSPESNSGIAIYGGTTISGNVIENVPNGIVVTDSASNVSGNQIFDVPYSVDPLTSSYAIFVFSSGSIHNNVVHDLVQGASALYLEAGMNETGNTQYIYNNLLWNVGDTAPVVIASDVLGSSSTSNQFIYNNTLSGGATAGCITVNPNYFVPTNLTVENNHCISDQPASSVWCANQAGGNFDCGSVANLVLGNNVLMTSSAATSAGYTLADSYQPTAASSATVGVGLNLGSNCATIGAPLCSDRLGVVRPSGSAAWDVGAYQYQSGTSSIAPIITQQPSRQEVTAGLTATFSVVAAGSAPLAYQWQMNGTPVSGATSSTYSAPAGSADRTVFTVVVSNAAGSVTSSPAILSVSAAQGQLTLNPATGLNFGTVNVGTASSSSVSLSNMSVDYITISNLSVSGAGFSVSGVPSGIILAPGEAATLNVVFAPSGTGAVPGSVTISSDAAGSPATIPLTGTGITPPHSVTLDWNPNIPTPFGYYVYRATNQYGPYTRLNPIPVATTQFTDISVVPGQTYLYWVTAVVSDTIESPFSGSVTVVVPTP